MPDNRSYFGHYKMHKMLYQLALISATTALSLACGDVLLGEGNISSPNYPKNYPDGIYCYWTLSATEGRLVSLQITDFHVENNFDYVYIFKGTQTTVPSYQFTGSSHGNDERLILSSTITIKFVSDMAYSDCGFRMKFESVNATYFTACGGEVHESGNITSPNYPQQYPANSFCTWTLTTTSFRSIWLRLINIDLENGFDYLNIYNGRVLTKQHLTHNLTGFYPTDLKPTFYGESVTIVFSSDNTYAKSGFLIEFGSIDINPYTACGGELNGSGIITTPNYPHNYPDNSYCLWKVTATKDQDIYMRLLEFNTELNYDFLDFSPRYPEIPTSKRYTGGYSNTSLPVASEQTVYLIFQSDSSYSDSGFRLELKTVSTKCPTVAFCGGELQGSGIITFSDSECSQANCTWTITASPDHALSIQIADMSTNDGDLYIYNGTQLTRDYSYFQYTGSNWRTARPILLGPSCQVVFIRTLASSFLKLEFKSVPRSLNAACGGEFIGSGRITSRNIPDHHLYNSHCIWQLRAMADHMIGLRIAGFNALRQQASLYVFNASVPRVPHLLYPHTTIYKENEKLILPGPNAVVVFYGNFTTRDSSFEVLFESFNLTTYTVCGGVINGSGEIVSPNYPSNYPSNCRCTWRLSATAGLSVALKLTAMNKEILYDYVKVYSVTGPNDTLLELFSDYPLHPRAAYVTGWKDSTGLTFSPPVGSFNKPTAFGSNLLVSFTSDITISNTGFRIEFFSINTTSNKECGGQLQDSGVITSPNYPRQYPNNSLCTWRLKATPGSTISLRIVDFNTENSYDYLFVTALSYVYWGDGEFFTGMKPEKYDKKPIDLGREGTVIFMSDLTNSAAGFQIEFTSTKLSPFTDCGEKLYGSGDLTSPNYPHHYTNKSQCLWKLIAESGRSVLLHIVEFNTEKYNDYVDIFDDKKAGSHSIYRFSGIYNTTRRIKKVLVPGMYATILFRSDNSISDTGFRIQFLSAHVMNYTGCGGEFRGSGNITSPNYPANYPNNSRCTWRLLADAGHVVSLRLIDINTEYDYDVVSIYNGSLPILTNSSYNYTGHIGEQVKPMTLGASVTVVFISDVSESASGFLIEFTSVYPANNTGNAKKKPCLRRGG